MTNTWIHGVARMLVGGEPECVDHEDDWIPAATGHDTHVDEER